MASELQVGKVVVGDSSTNELLVGFESSSQDFSLGANGSNFMVCANATDLDDDELLRISSTGLATFTNSGSQHIVISDGAGTPSTWDFGRDSSTGSLVIRQNAATKMTVSGAGLATFSGGIAFSQTNSTATGVSDDSTTLNHYESGSWSPTLFKGTIGGTLTQHTGASVYGKYVRIGNLVWVSFYILQGAGGTQSASGQWVVKGLPFPVKEGAAAGHQSIPSNYFQLNGTNFFNASPHRWQANATDALQMYGTQNATAWSSGAMEFGGAGVLHIDY